MIPKFMRFCSVYGLIVSMPPSVSVCVNPSRVGYRVCVDCSFCKEGHVMESWVASCIYNLRCLEYDNHTLYLLPDSTRTTVCWCNFLLLVLQSFSSRRSSDLIDVTSCVIRHQDREKTPHFSANFHSEWKWKCLCWSSLLISVCSPVHPSWCNASIDLIIINLDRTLWGTFLL